MHQRVEQFPTVFGERRRRLSSVYGEHTSGLFLEKIRAPKRRVRVRSFPRGPPRLLLRAGTRDEQARA